MTDIIIIILLVAVIILLLMLISKKSDSQINTFLEKQYNNLRKDISSSNHDNIRSFGEIVSGNQKNLNDIISSQLKIISDNLDEKQNTSLTMFTRMNSLTEQRFNTFTADTEKKLENIKLSVQNGLSDIQADTDARLNQIQDIVEEKLQKTLDTKISRSFSDVSMRLEKVYKELGEVQSIASGVSDLKKILTNVKSRGILGELQLRNILQETLSPSQYIENARIKSGFVEFAVIIPAENDEHILLPVDSKFPADTYMHFRDALENGDKSEITETRKNLIARFKSEAKDIYSKYINPPETTDFAVMFLPFEGLYAEAVNCGMIEALQRDYHITVAGPSTMTALLNSLRMGFQSMAIQKQSDNVWKVLSEVKKEFEKFADALENTQKKLNTAGSELENLVGTRTRMLRRQLQNVAESDNNNHNNNQNGV